MIGAQFLDVLDNVVIPRDYPEVSTRVADRVVLRLRRFEEPFTALNILPLLGWTAQPDKEMVSEHRLTATHKQFLKNLIDYQE